jgi:hypothetical protein
VRVGRIITVHALIAVGVNADGHREILGIDVATAEDGAGRLAFLRCLWAGHEAKRAASRSGTTSTGCTVSISLRKGVDKPSRRPPG